MFLLAGNIMPGTEKLWGELLFPEEKWLFFSTEGRKNSFSKGNKCSSQSFFALGIMFFSLKDTFSWCFILWPTINHYILMGSDSYCPYRLCIISWPIGRPPAERRGVQGGDPPAKAKRRLLKYLKKGNYNLVATNWVGPKQQKITKNNRFEKLLISKISNYRKHYISKTTTNEENSNFQKTTNFEQEAW